MKIILAPDSFKGSLSAVEACQALEEGTRRVFPDAQIVSIPLADGGEGTLEALLAGGAGLIKNTRVRGPLGVAVEADWGIRADGRAILEMAKASGLTLTPPAQRDALRASSFGSGQLIKAALDAGCREFIIGVGGSATTDGGVGALTALGLQARDTRQRALASGGGSLVDLMILDTQFLDARLAKSKFIVLCDVFNPLLGSNGAAQVYAPQKGASPDEVARLESGLERLAEIAAATLGRDLSDQPGAGAAGGLAFGLMTFCNAQLSSGIEMVLEANDFAAQLQGADLVLTGEGALDAQTLSGKTIAGLCRVARAQNVAVIAFGGMVQLKGAQMNELGLRSAFSLVEGPRDLNSCLKKAAPLLADAAERVLRLWPT